MTIKEIAQMAGVSTAAVSRYFNGGSLSQEKRESIRKTIEETGYRPDTTAQMLRTRVTDYVGVIVPKVSANAVGHVTDGIAEVLLENGYLCLLANSAHNPEQELSFLELFEGRAVAGIILMATVLTPRHEDCLKNCSVPLVVAGQKYEGIPCIYHDDFHAAKELTERMLQRGRKRLAYIGVTQQDVAVGVHRKQGVEAALAAAGLDAKIPCAISSFGVEGGKQTMEELLAAHRDLDGVMCATDQIAIGAMTALKEAGKRIPEDVSIAGIGDSWAGTYVTPKLTTARLYYRACGMEAASLLLSMMQSDKKKELPVRQTMLGYTVIDRESI